VPETWPLWEDFLRGECKSDFIIGRSRNKSDSGINGRADSFGVTKGDEQFAGRPDRDAEVWSGRRQWDDRQSMVFCGDSVMNIAYRSVIAVALLAAPTAPSWAQNLNPGNSGGGHAPIATPSYAGDEPSNPALTTGSRLSVKSDTPAVENPTVPGATGEAIVHGDGSTISGDRRGTIEQKTGGPASDAPG
jgi:hypothetical protein